MKQRITGSTPVKGLTRGLDRRGTRSDMSPPVAQKGRAPEDPSVCDVCGSIYTAKTWRRDRPLPAKLINAAAWTICPACKQAKSGEYFGRVLIRGSNAISNLDAIRARIANVERRAEFTQPERRIVSSKWDGATLEVLTTSQKLAHRIARELQKAFGGRARYTWSDQDGALTAVWEGDTRRPRA
jgi:RNA polymerase subunit RPABC4/transcription elongation factor Spt4